MKSWSGLEGSSKQRQQKDGTASAGLGELELKSFTPGAAPADEGSRGGANSSPPSILSSQPLYEALARRLSVLQASGALAEPGPAAAAHSSSPSSSAGSRRSAQRRKLPRFEDWRWREGRYAQFLVDCLEVHSALEEAVEGALAAAAGVAAAAEGGSGGSSPSPSSSSSPSLAAFAAISYLGRSSGLFRAAEIAEDLAAISRTTPEGVPAGGEGAAGKATSSGSASAAPRIPPPDVKPSASASATARYLLALGSRAAREVVLEAEEEAAGQGGGGEGGVIPRSSLKEEKLLRRRRRRQGEGPGRAEESSGAAATPASASAALRLLANCYALQVTHLTTGMRVGASASEALGLLRRRAAGFYQAYPDDLSLAPRRPPLLLLLLLSPASGSADSSIPRRDNKRIVDPLRAFRSAVDGAGRVLSPPPASASHASADAAAAAAAHPLSPPPPPPLLLEEVEKELVAAVRRAASLFEPLASAE